MKIFSLFFIILFCANSVFSQENYIKHVVVEGDNIYQIAKKYNLKPQAIFEINPKTASILKLNSVLLIPNGEVNEIADSAIKSNTTTIHKVAQKETLYGISKQYGISVQDLKVANPTIEKEGLRAEQQIIIPLNNSEVNLTKSSLIKKEKSITVIATEETPIISSKQYTREVKQKETKYGIAKEYGITVAELEEQNPEIKNSFQAGQQLQIATSKLMQIDSVALSEGSKNEKKHSSLEKPDSFEEEANDELVDQLVITASENIGTRYRSGGTTKDGFDCSGLMVSSYGNCNIQLPRTSKEQSEFGTKINFEEAQKGDLIFFKTNGRQRINHVGMVVEANGTEIKFIHASVQGGVIISSTRESYYEKKYAQVNRVLKFK